MNKPQATQSVLFVCLGNICRSPMAAGVFSDLVAQQGLESQIEVDSAGTGNWHIGKPPDARAIAAAADRNIDIAGFKARQANAFDMAFYDYIIAMDAHNQADLQRLAGREQAHKVKLFLEFAADLDESEVPDPYYGAVNGFDRVYALLETASHGLLAKIKANLHFKA